MRYGFIIDEHSKEHFGLWFLGTLLVMFLFHSIYVPIFFFLLGVGWEICNNYQPTGAQYHFDMEQNPNHWIAKLFIWLGNNLIVEDAHFDWADLLFDAAGISAALVVYMLLVK